MRTKSKSGAQLVLDGISSYCGAKYGDLFSCSFHKEMLLGIISSAVASEIWLLPETVLYRVRKNIDPQKEDITSFSTFSYPSAAHCKENGRAHIYGHPVFYCSDTAKVSLLESRPELGDSVYIACWTPREPCKVMASFNTTKEALTNSFLFHMYAAFGKASDEITLRANFLEWSGNKCNVQIANLFADELYPYSHTSVYSHLLMHGGFSHMIDMVVYPSAEWRNTFINIAMRTEAADALLDLETVYKLRVQADSNHSALFTLSQIGKPNNSVLEWHEATESDHDAFYNRVCSDPSMFVLEARDQIPQNDMQAMVTDIDRLVVHELAKSKGPESVLNVQELFSEALSLTNSGDYRRAIRDLNRCIESAGFMATFRYQRGLCYHLMGKYDDAIRDYTGALRLADMHRGQVHCHHKAYCNRGTCYQESGRYELAKADFESALAICPDDDKSHFNLGNCLVLMGRLTDALACYERALVLSPSDVAIRSAKEELAQQISQPESGQGSPRPQGGEHLPPAMPEPTA